MRKLKTSEWHAWIGIALTVTGVTALWGWQIAALVFGLYLIVNAAVLMSGEDEK